MDGEQLEQVGRVHGFEIRVLLNERNKQITPPINKPSELVSLNSNHSSQIRANNEMDPNINSQIG